MLSKSKLDLVNYRDSLYRFNMKVTCGGLSQSEIADMLSDGRASSHLTEKYVTKILGLQPSHANAAYDACDDEGNKFEIRSITSANLKLIPSYMLGQGRRYEEDGYLKKLKSIWGFIVVDTRCYPNYFAFLIKSFDNIMMHDNKPKRQLSLNCCNEYINNLANTINI